MSGEFRHKVFYGKTFMGKTWAMKRIAAECVAMRQRALVWTAADTKGWPTNGALVTMDEDQLQEWLDNPAMWGNAHVFIDEAATLYEDTTKKTHPTLWRITRECRHRGMTVYMATQRPKIIPARVRDQFEEVFCFRLSDIDMAKYVYDCHGTPEIDGRPAYELITQLPPKVCIHILHGEAELLEL